MRRHSDCTKCHKLLVYKGNKFSINICLCASCDETVTMIQQRHHDVVIAKAHTVFPDAKWCVKI